MNKKNVTIIVVVVIVVAAVVGFGAMRARQNFQSQFENLQIVEVERGSLIATIGGTGTVRANQSANLVWKTSGTVEAVNAIVGEDITEGLVLASLVETSLPQNVILAQDDLATAQQILDDISDNADLRQAETLHVVAEAQQAVEDAELTLNSLIYPAGSSYILEARANLILTKMDLKKQEQIYRKWKDKPDSVSKAEKMKAYAWAVQAFDRAETILNWLTANGSEMDIASAESGLAVAEAELEQAMAANETLDNGIDPEELSSAELNLAAAQAGVDAQNIIAPFDGTLTVATPKRGDQVNSGTISFRLDDLSRLLVEVDISEVDINRVQVGQDVLMVFDAVLAKEYHGKVVDVGLVGSADQGIVNFLVTVEILDGDELVRPGMTAAVNIVVTELENALMIPNRAVRLIEGQRVVYIISNNQLEPIEITLGSSSDTYSEVIDGDLSEGDEIILNPPAQFQPGRGGPGGGGPFGGN